MQQVVCPGCGAPVQFKSAASVMAVCEFCKTTLLKDASSVSAIGKMSEVLEDYSPLQIGTSGLYRKRAFTLVGRIQLQYSSGIWNEWYALFDDGTAGWVSDASGQYAVTVDSPTAGATLPIFEKLLPGRPLSIAGKTYITSDVHTARCTAGQGELPFKVGEGWEARVADFRAIDGFLSLDYSDADKPRLYVGDAVELAQLQAQLLRDVDQISDAAGHFRGKVAALSCPACGAPVNVVPGMTVHLVCPSCHAEVDTAGTAATVLAAGARVDAARFSLALGSEAAIDGARYTVLGAMRRAVVDDEYTWVEYLLYSPGRRFTWIIETDDGWSRAEVLNRWPAFAVAGQPVLDERRFSELSRYQARVVFAAGSFNWRVSVGDVVEVTEYAAGPIRLSAEITAEEMTWSRSAPLALDQVRAMFGQHVNASASPQRKFTDTARRFVILLFIINSIPLLFAAGSCLFYVLLAAAAIYVPALYMDRLDSEAT